MPNKQIVNDCFGAGCLALVSSCPSSCGLGGPSCTIRWKDLTNKSKGLALQPLTQQFQVSFNSISQLVPCINFMHCSCTGKKVKGRGDSKKSDKSPRATKPKTS